MQSTSSSAGAPAPPGWYPDPWQVAPTRWWDGMTWTGFTTPTTQATVQLVTQPVATSLPVARTDIEGGGIAVLGYFGALALSILGSLLAIALGAQRLTVPVMVFGQFGLWSGLGMAAFIASHRGPGGTLADLGFRAPNAREIKLGIGMGVLGLLIAGRVTYVLVHLFPDNGGGARFFVASRPSNWFIAATFVFACIGAPIVEELYFRGLVQPVLVRNLGSTPGIVAQAMFFGAAHFQVGMTFNQAAVKCGTIFVLGLFLGWLRSSTGRLGAGMVAHATNNVIAVLAAIAMMSR